MTLSYGSAPKGSAQAHTGVQVPIAGDGPNAAAVADLDEQTDLFDLISSLLGLQNRGLTKSDRQDPRQRL